MKLTSRLVSFGTLALAAGLLSTGSAHAQWNVTVQARYDADPTNDALFSSFIGTDVETLAEAEFLLANGGTPEATATPNVIHYRDIDNGSTIDNTQGNYQDNGSVNFPAGTPVDQFALLATSTVTVVGAPSAQVYFYVNSDDGFDLQLNGTSLISANAPSFLYDTNVITPTAVTVTTGDVLRLTYFQKGQGDFVYLYQDADGLLSTFADRTLLTSDAVTGVTFVAAVVPEAGTLALLAPALLGGIVLAARRRK